MNIKEYKETLVFLYSMYKDNIDEGYRILSYLEWLEMHCYNLNEEIKKKNKLKNTYRPKPKQCRTGL